MISTNPKEYDFAFGTRKVGHAHHKPLYEFAKKVDDSVKQLAKRTIIGGIKLMIKTNNLRYSYHP